MLPYNKEQSLWRTNREQIFHGWSWAAKETTPWGPRKVGHLTGDEKNSGLPLNITSFWVTVGLSNSQLSTHQDVPADHHPILPVAWGSALLETPRAR